MAKSKLFNKGTGAFLLVLLILFCFYPYEFTSVYFRFIPRDSHFIILMTVVAGILYLSCSKRARLPLVIIVLSFFQFFGLLIHSVYIGQNVFGIIAPLFVVLFPLFLVLYTESTIGLLEFYRRYNKWILIMAILGTTVWLVDTIIGLPPVSIVNSRADKEGNRLILNYILTFAPTNGYYFERIRYSGFFDEPGAMANWGLYALIINKLFIKNKRLELILSICLVFTFSLGYYVQLAVYLLLFNIDFKRIGNSLLYVVIVVVLLGGLQMTKGTSYNAIYESTIGRVTEAYNQSQSGDDVFDVDSRTGLTKRAKELFLESPLMGTTRQGERFGNNIYETLATYGLIGAPLVLLPFLYWLFIAIKRKDMEFLKAIIVVMIGFTHRPFHLNPLSFFVLYSIIFMYLKNSITIEKDYNHMI